MALKSILDTLDGVHESLHEHYTAKDGKFHLAADGMVPKSRLDEFRDTNIATRRELDDLRTRFDGVDPEEFRKLSDAAAKVRDKRLIEAGKVDELIAERVAAMRGEHDKVLGALTKERDTTKGQLEGLLIDGALRDAAAKAGVRPTAIDDVLLRGRQTFRLADGRAQAFDGDKPAYGKDGEAMSVQEWVGGLSERAPHLFEQSSGGGTPKGGNSTQGGAKTMTRAAFDAIPIYEQAAAIKGVTITD